MSKRAIESGLRVFAAAASILASAAPHAVCARWSVATSGAPAGENAPAQPRPAHDAVTACTALDPCAGRNGASRPPFRGGAWLESAVSPSLTSAAARSHANDRLCVWLRQDWRLRSDPAPLAFAHANEVNLIAMQILRGIVAPRSPPA